MTDYSFEVNWFGGGFFDLIDRYIISPGTSDDHDVALFLKTFHESLEGNFRNIDGLVKIVRDTFPSHVGSASASLIGCAGSSALVDTLISDPSFRSDSDKIHALAMILAVHGRLSDAETLLDIFLVERDKKTDWFEGYPGWISDILEIGTDALMTFDSADKYEYEHAIRKLISDLKTNFGENTFLFGGMQVSEMNMKYVALEKIKKNLFLVSTRIRLEAYFGVDCTRFYDSNGSFLAQNAIEAVENIPVSEGYETGKKYFFGHIIE